MKKAQDQHADVASLRKRAESRLAENRKSQPVGDEERKAHDEPQRLIQELQIHQIELEMQNEELRRATGELEVLQARYFDLYDLAPVGYFSVSEQGLILETNLTAATLLGVVRKKPD
jgi:PAS domain-containing protein